MKTNATRILDELGVPYTLREYEVDPCDLSAETVVAIAREKRASS
jgi:Cys-tRNA(Pro)/Cys-tRNA(Cys) deacylase